MQHHIPDDTVKQWIKESYELVTAKLTRKEKEKLEKLK
jgi:predicted DNA-binding protein (MmcQ/YjbR family)